MQRTNLRQLLRPPLHLLVDGFGLVEDGLVWREVVEPPALVPVLGADPKLGESRKHVQFGDEQLRQSVHPNGVPKEDRVQPAAAAGSPGHGAELPADPPHVGAGLSGVLGWKRTGSHAGHVSLGHPDDPAHLGRSQPGSGQDARGDAARGRDERIRPPVEIEQRSSPSSCLVAGSLHTGRGETSKGSG